MTPRELQKQAIVGFTLPGLIFLIWYLTLIMNMKTQEPQRIEEGWRVGLGDTPRTDAAAASGGNQLLNIANCSRSLERELDAANAEIKRLKDALERAYRDIAEGLE